MGSPWSWLGSWTPHTDQACAHLLRPSRGPSDGGSGKNEGSSVFCRDRGGGEARARLGRGRPPAPSRSPRRVCCGHRPGVACPCGQTAPAHPAWPQLPRLPPPWECQPGQAAPAVGVPAGPGLFLSALLFVFFQCHSKREKEKGKKKGRNCSEMIQSFLQKCLLSSCREGTPPHRVEKMSSAFSGPAWPWLSPGSPTPPGRCRGETSLFLVVASHP